MLEQWLQGDDLNFMSFWMRDFTESLLVTSATLMVVRKTDRYRQTDKQRQRQKDRQTDIDLYIDLFCLSEPRLAWSLLFTCANLPTGVGLCVCCFSWPEAYLDPYYSQHVVSSLGFTFNGLLGQEVVTSATAPFFLFLSAIPSHETYLAAQNIHKRQQLEKMPSHADTNSLNHGL